MLAATVQLSDLKELNGASEEIERSRDRLRCSESILPVIFMHYAQVTGEVGSSFSRVWEKVGVIKKKLPLL